MLYIQHLMMYRLMCLSTYHRDIISSFPCLFFLATVFCLVIWSWPLSDLLGSCRVKNNYTWINKSKFSLLTVISASLLLTLNENLEAEAHKSIHLGACPKTMLSWHTAVTVLNWPDKDKGTRKIQYFSCSLECRTMPATRACGEQNPSEWM